MLLTEFFNNSLLAHLVPTNPVFSRFLLVDDHQIDTLIITRVLLRSELVAHIDTAQDGQAALAYLTASQRTNQYPEVILLDIDMPVMNGFDFLKQCFAEGLLGNRAVRIIMLTSSIHPVDQKKADGYRLAGFLQKPLKLESLRKVLALS